MHCACDADDVNAFLNRNVCFYSAVNALAAEVINHYLLAFGPANLNSTALGYNLDFVSLNLRALFQHNEGVLYYNFRNVELDTLLNS